MFTYICVAVIFYYYGKNMGREEEHLKLKKEQGGKNHV